MIASATLLLIPRGLFREALSERKEEPMLLSFAWLTSAGQRGVFEEVCR